MILKQDLFEAIIKAGDRTDSPTAQGLKKTIDKMEHNCKLRRIRVAN